MRRFVRVPHGDAIERIALTDNVLDRYLELLRPCATRAQAHIELSALCILGRLSSQPPAWSDDVEREDRFYLVFAGDYSLIVLAGDTGLFAPTLTARGGVSPMERARRRGRRRKRRSRLHGHMEPSVEQRFRGERRDRLERDSDERRDAS